MSWLHDSSYRTDTTEHREKWSSSSSYGIISWHLLLGTQERGCVFVWGLLNSNTQRNKQILRLPKKKNWKEKVQNVSRSTVEPIKHYVRSLVVFFILPKHTLIWSTERATKYVGLRTMLALQRNNIPCLLFGILVCQSVSSGMQLHRRNVTQRGCSLATRVKQLSTIGPVLLVQDVLSVNVEAERCNTSVLKVRVGAAMLTQPHLLDPNWKCNAL